MLQLNKKDLAIYKSNLIIREKTFNVESKRGDKNIVINGKKTAKLSRRNSIDYLDKNESKKIVSLFASVKKSINRFLFKNDFSIAEIEKKYGSVFVNRGLFDALPIGTQFRYVDVKHCYWRIAYLKGYITKYYYDKVLEKPDLKLFRNMALACIIANKQVEYFKSGMLVATISEDNSLYECVYRNIRHTAWNLFGSLAFEKIGEDNCIGYFTDGIMVFENDLKKVTTVLARHKLQHRIILCEKTAHREYVYVDEGVVRKI
jgi:hypothetical protein